MPTKLNLASKPFSNRSLPWVVSALIITVSLISMVFIVRATRRTTAQANLVQNDINILSRQEHELRERAQAIKNSLTNEQLQTLTAAQILVDRKHFSWSRLFADLESALPGDVRVKRIAVREIATVRNQTLADLELTVIAKSPVTVTDMIADMAKTGIFDAQLRSQTLQRGRGEGGAEYELAVRYQPRAGVPTEPVAAVQPTTDQRVKGL
jgi:Tfp pilus assembly protein PilN